MLDGQNAEFKAGAGIRDSSDRIVSRLWARPNSRFTLRDIRLPPLCKCDLRSSEMLTQRWLVVTEISGQHMGPIGYSETSVTNYESTLRNILEERTSFCTASSPRAAHIGRTARMNKVVSAAAATRPLSVSAGFYPHPQGLIRIRG
jgi:hypothetical protein